MGRRRQQSQSLPFVTRGWRRVRDSNPRYQKLAHTLSRRAPSTARATLRDAALRRHRLTNIGHATHSVGGIRMENHAICRNGNANRRAGRSCASCDGLACVGQVSNRCADYRLPKRHKVRPGGDSGRVPSNSPEQLRSLLLLPIHHPQQGHTRCASFSLMVATLALRAFIGVCSGSAAA